MSKQAFNNPVREGFRWERYQAGPATDRYGDGEGLVSRGGLVWLGEVADRSGLTAGLSLVLADVPRRRHDPGVGLAQLVVALADGLSACPTSTPCVLSRAAAKTIRHRLRHVAAHTS